MTKRPQPNTRSGHDFQFTTRDLSEKFGLKNPMEVMRFLNSPEGKEIKSEMIAKLEIDKALEEQAAFAAIQEKLNKVSASRPTDGRLAFAKIRREVSEEVLKKLNEEAPKHKHEEDARPNTLAETYNQYTVDELDKEHDLLQEDLESYQYEHSDLAQAVNDLNLDEAKVLEFFDRLYAKKETAPVKNHEAEKDLEAKEEKDFLSQLDAYKETLKNELAGLEQALTQSDLAPRDQPSAAPTAKPQHQQGQQRPAQTQQLQSMRANFCKGMLHIINQHAEHGQQPTQGHNALKREQLSQETDLTGVKHQILNHFQACRSNVAQQRDLTKLKMDATKLKIQTVSKTLAEKAADPTSKHKAVAEKYDSKVKQYTAATKERPEAPRQASSYTPKR